MSDGLEQALQALRAERQAIAERATPAFTAKLDELRVWQARHVALVHRPIADRHDGHALLHFLTDSFYLEADWSELTAHPQRIAERIERVIHDDRPLVVSIKLQQTADHLDARMADALLARGNRGAITPCAYVRAFRAVDAAATRDQQVLWLGELVDRLGEYADNRAAYWAFKLAGTPARALGLGRAYALLAEGFAALRSSRDLDTATRQAVRHQQRLTERLLGADPRR